MKTADDSTTEATPAARSTSKRVAGGKAPVGKGSTAAPKPRKSRSDHAPQQETADYPEPEVVGGHEPLGKTRKRRHNRRHKEESTSSAQRHPAVDTDELVSRAWKIFKGEVTEEGLALMDDQTAAETARRAFRVAELFLIEAAAHRSGGTRQ